MFIVLLTYKKSLELVEEYLAGHIIFLDECYQKNYFVVSGRKNPRTGGVIISQLKDRSQIDDVIKQDPFYINQLADYEVIEFIPTKHHPGFSGFITSQH